MVSTRSLVLASFALSMIAPACSGDDAGGSTPADTASSGDGGTGPSGAGPGPTGNGGGGVTSSATGDTPDGVTSTTVGSGPSSGPGGSESSGSGGRSGSSTGVGGAAPGCTHTGCEQGGPLDPSCGNCISDVCAIDPGCCSSNWDAGCVSLLESQCPSACPKPCNDTGPGEPSNGDVTTPWNLNPITDCDAQLNNVSGTLAAFDDTDFYVFDGDDTVACSVDPTITVTPATIDACVYFYCHAGTTSVLCPAGTTDATDAFGDPGCCGSGTIAPILNCTGSNDEAALVYIEVQDDAAACTNYSVAYHF